jgi:SAM-dependent methyltransferase
MGVTDYAAAALRRSLAEPGSAGHDLDEAATTVRHRELIRSKAFLRRIYDEWYCLLAQALPPIAGVTLEIGSGGAFFGPVGQRIIRSDVLQLPDLHVALDATRLPFGGDSLRAIVMTNVFHHIPDADAFLSEARRCLRPGGVLAMIEPWATPWSRWVYTTLHHERFDPAAPTWRLEPGRPLTSANSALPWIVFERDRSVLERRFPQLRVAEITPLMPLRYLISGGVSMRSTSPSWTFGLWRRFDELLLRITPAAAMFAHIVVVRQAAPVRQP